MSVLAISVTVTKALDQSLEVLTMGVLASATRSPEAIFRKRYPVLICETLSQSANALTAQRCASDGGNAQRTYGLISA